MSPPATRRQGGSVLQARAWSGAAAWRPLATAALVFLSVQVAACKAKDTTPVGAARAVWAATDGDADGFRALYPTAAQLRALFVPKQSEAMLAQIERATAALRKRPARVEVLEAKVDRLLQVPPGDGLRQPARLALVKLRLRVSGMDTDDELTLIQLGKHWRALPKQARRYLK